MHLVPDEFTKKAEIIGFIDRQRRAEGTEKGKDRL